MTSVGSGKTLLMDILGDLCKSAEHINVVRCHMNEASYILHKRLAFVNDYNDRDEKLERKHAGLAILSARRWRQFITGKFWLTTYASCGSSLGSLLLTMKHG